MGLLGEHKIRGLFGTLLLHSLVPYHCSNPFKWIGLTNWLHSSYTGKDQIKKNSGLHWVFDFLSLCNIYPHHAQ